MKHIAILKPVFYNMILTGEKTIESRWSKNKCAPYNKIKIGDEIFFKKTGENVTAKAVVLKVKFYELTPNIIEEIKMKYGKLIGLDKFKDYGALLNKKYCTLIWLENVKEIKPIEVKKSNGAGWIILN